MYYLKIFYINSVIGYILESIFYFLFKWHGNSGILFGPWTPVYGIGSVLIVIVFKIINKKLNINKFLKFLIFFLIISITLSSIEILGGYLIEAIFHKEFWNYEDHLLNIGKYASVEMSIIWGIAAFIYIFFIKKIVDGIEKKIPKSIIYIVTILFIIDIIATLVIKI